MKHLPLLLRNGQRKRTRAAGTRSDSSAEPTCNPRRIGPRAKQTWALAWASVLTPEPLTRPAEVACDPGATFGGRKVAKMRGACVAECLQMRLFCASGLTPPYSRFNTDNTKSLFAGLLEPSDGLEPSTPSLPSRFWRGKGGQSREAAGTKAALREGIARKTSSREWTLVPGRVFPQRSLNTEPNLATVGARGDHFSVRLLLTPAAA
jgi:hypothetical protein